MGDLDQLWALSERYGVPGVDLNEIVILIEDLGVIPRDVCETHHILPLLVRGDQIFLAMENPLDRRAIEEIEFVTGRKVYPYVALPHALQTATVAAHAARDAGAAHYVGSNVPADRARETQGAPIRHQPVRTDPAPPPLPASLGEVFGAVVLPPRPRAAPPAIAEQTDADALSVDVDLSEIEGEASVPKGPQSDLRGSAGRATVGSRLILVVDDEEDIRTMLKRVLVAQGHRVVEADSGPVALRLVKHHVPDLIILDAMLPELHGFDIARRIKGSEKYGAHPHHHGQRRVPRAGASPRT